MTRTARAAARGATARRVAEKNTACFCTARDMMATCLGG